MTQIMMLAVDIAPKLKFNEGSKIRPWVIPPGLDFQVISPPSNQTQYLNIGVQFGTGFEYEVRKTFQGGPRRPVPSCQRPNEHGEQLRDDRALCRHWVLTEVRSVSFSPWLTTFQMQEEGAGQGPRGLVGSDAFDADRMECLVDGGESIPSRKASKPEWSERSARPSRVLA